MKSLFSLALLAPTFVYAQMVQSADDRVFESNSQGRLEMYAVADDVLRLDFRPYNTQVRRSPNVSHNVGLTGAPGLALSFRFAGGSHRTAQRLISDAPTDIMDPNGLRRARPVGGAVGNMLQTAGFAATVEKDGMLRLLSRDGSTNLDIKCAPNDLSIIHDSNEHLYGMRGIGLGDRPVESSSLGLLRDEGAPVSAGAQGDGGAPMAYTTHWGLIVDSVDGQFANANGDLDFSRASRKEIEAYLVIGSPKRTIEVATELTGHPPMSPKWALGFMNSQWGTTEKEVDEIIDTYRQKQIPIDAFILDFDFKAWGEDNFGEFRWNSTNGAGNVSPNKYPDGASGAFGKKMISQGIHLIGIMKPRILMQNTAKQPTVGAKEVTAHNWWLPGEKPYQDYFSGRPAGDLDFSQSGLRHWYWQHADGLFNTGIAGWWNDEADDGFDSLGFFHMQQSLFEGQESVSNRRVWSLNRNFYLGAQRFAFGTWSGDIRTGFASMQDQRARMLATLDLGQPHWSMDSGGFHGHPSPENYARWIEFAATVPIMRVHNTYGEHRQPWVYGSVAEAAAKKAIEWRYSLFPYLYSLEHHANETGVGIDRPLFWEFPDDPACANVTDSWMMGDSLLVSPTVELGQTFKTIYLPPGAWYGYFDGHAYQGGHNVTVECDSQTWSDLPVFVRAGSIVATQPVLQFENERPVRQITLDIWPDASRKGHFEVYDDDGETRNWERGGYFSQEISCEDHSVEFSRSTGRYHSPIATYKVRIHGPFRSATFNEAPVPVRQEDGCLVAIVKTGIEGRIVVGS